MTSRPPGIQELVELGPMSLLLNGDGHDERQVELEAKIEAKLASTGHDFLKVCSFGMLDRFFLQVFLLS